MVSIPKMHPDVIFPQLATITSCESVREILQRELPVFARGGHAIETVKIERFQYKPGKSCSICYRLEVKTPEAPNTSAPILLSLSRSSKKFRYSSRLSSLVKSAYTEHASRKMATAQDLSYEMPI